MDQRESEIVDTIDTQADSQKGEVLASRRPFLNFGRKELEQIIVGELGLEKYRVNQLIQWVYRRRVYDFSLMTDISKQVRERLEQTFSITLPKVHSIQHSKDGTKKYLLELADGKRVESVLIKQPKRFTLCVSSQVGCAIGCTFCQTGTMGLIRNLQTAEILGQVLVVQDHIEALRLAEEEGRNSGEGRVSVPEQFANIVFMGMGEPLHNFDNMERAVRLLTEPLGFQFSSRKITVSTSGLVPKIKEFGEREIPANLAVSLNATTDEVRSQIIPINKKWPLEKLLESLREMKIKPGRRITIEYVMLHRVNDSDADLRRLPLLLHGVPTKLNLIPYNSNAGLGFYPPPEELVSYWHRELLARGISTTVRWSKGRDIDAACGQLVTQKQEAPEISASM